MAREKVNQDKKGMTHQAMQAYTEEHRVEAWRLRKMGYSVKEIAFAMDFAESTVYDYLKAISNRLIEQQFRHAESYREMQLARLDDALRLTIDYVVTKGKIEGVDRILKVIDMQNRLLGLYKVPAKLTLTKAVTDMTDEEIEEALKQYNDPQFVQEDVKLGAEKG
jgi:transposase-like protein